jgi:hypothetical protein
MNVQNCEFGKISVLTDGADTQLASEKAYHESHTHKIAACSGGWW